MSDMVQLSRGQERERGHCTHLTGEARVAVGTQRGERREREKKDNLYVSMDSLNDRATYMEENKCKSWRDCVLVRVVSFDVILFRLRVSRCVCSLSFHRKAGKAHSGFTLEKGKSK